ncbi:FAM10 family protein At4g22670 isoform X3 [Nymphaea colorata]|uniref:FAM10 family protein At4g22670 isoform X2 n=1 Tax=Nymphaea colorata TaxID=210225 RepID=UPI00214F46D2|nr:FAM10 family protein At4g22670 isoform X2 [Nymphaea colorata]XP_049935784.1 FAM10 family protein At4g22670 isoform X3 [Nymphaea colorata]
MELPRVEQLREFIALCRSDPSVLQDPSLLFFREYLTSLGAKLPWDSSKSSFMEQHSDAKMSCGSSIDDPDDDIVESDIELQGDVVELDNDPPQKMGDPSIEVTQEHCDAAQIAKARAMVAISEGRLIEAIDDLTEAILLNPGSAILYATRATVFVKLSKPNAAIRDADAALQINPDLAKGYKSRGMARSMIGEWQEAAKDLNLASNLDHDEEISAMLKKVTPNARKIEEHKRKYEGLLKERERKKAEEATRKEATAALKDGLGDGEEDWDWFGY